MWLYILCLKILQSKDIHGIMGIFKWFGLCANNQELEKLGNKCFFFRGLGNSLIGISIVIIIQVVSFVSHINT